MELTIPMSYTTVFEITQKPFEWWFSGVGFIGIAFGVLIILLGRKWPSRRRPVSSGYAVAVFCSLWTAWAFIASYSQYRKCIDAYRTGNYGVAEGRVEDFSPRPYAGHRDECFRVQGTSSCYSDGAIQAGFNQSASHGGPIREGLPVRIAYYDGQILRLEVASENGDARQTSK